MTCHIHGEEGAARLWDAHAQDPIPRLSVGRHDPVPNLAGPVGRGQEIGRCGPPVPGPLPGRHDPAVEGRPALLLLPGFGCADWILRANFGHPLAMEHEPRGSVAMCYMAKHATQAAVSSIQDAILGDLRSVARVAPTISER